MTPQDPLASLQPLRDPALVGWWPPAPGWWIALGIGLLALGLGIYLLLRRHRRSAYRRIALAQLETLRKRYESGGNSDTYLGDINGLLKSTALAAYPRQEVAALHGDAWVEFLNRALPSGRGFSREFAAAAYLPSPPPLDANQVHETASRWIKQHRVAA